MRSRFGVVANVLWAAFPAASDTPTYTCATIDDPAADTASGERARAFGINDAGYIVGDFGRHGLLAPMLLPAIRWSAAVASPAKSAGCTWRIRRGPSPAVAAPVILAVHASCACLTLIAKLLHSMARSECETCQGERESSRFWGADDVS